MDECIEEEMSQDLEKGFLALGTVPNVIVSIYLVILIQ